MCGDTSVWHQNTAQDRVISQRNDSYPVRDFTEILDLPSATFWPSRPTWMSLDEPVPLGPASARYIGTVHLTSYQVGVHQYYIK